MATHRLQYHIAIQELLTAITVGPIMSIIWSRTLKLFGHTNRSQAGLAKLCLEGMLDDRRSSGKQQKRWRENSYQWSRMNLNSVNRACQYGEVWKMVSHVHAQSAASGDGET